MKRRIQNDAHQSQPWCRLRCGFTLIEMIGTCVLLGVVISMTVPMTLLVARERRSTEQRQVAMQHAMNLLEAAMSKTWSELPPGSLDCPTMDQDLTKLLPGFEQSLVVRSLHEQPESRQITASIRWKNHAGQLVSPIRLSTWIFPDDASTLATFTGQPVESEVR